MSECRRHLDLTKPLDENLTIYAEGDYADPPFECRDWASIARHGFRVSRLVLGTQTGTHMDAPAHFLDDGATLDALPVDQMMGRYLLIDLPAEASADDLEIPLMAHRNQRILFLRTPQEGVAVLTRPAMERLLALPPAVWVLAGEIEVWESEPLEFHRMLARAGKYLVEDLTPKTALEVEPGGEIFVLPLRLTGTSGAPCRVVVRY
jgi:arylformamidase